MWCGACYTSSPFIKFQIVNVLQHQDPNKKERLESTWKPIHQNEDSYSRARNDDHTMIPFECDLCIFRKLRVTNPLADSYSDKFLLAVIRRANLDAFWSSVSGTVEKHNYRLRAGIKYSKVLGLHSPYYQLGSLFDYDHCGYNVACQMLLQSLNPGCISKEYTLWDTIRKSRSAFSNQVRAPNQANRATLAINDNKGVYQRIGQDVCGSFWFSHFLLGCQNRMGQESRQNKALSTPLLLELFKHVEIKISKTESLAEHNRWSVFSCYAAVAYAISLRGNATFLLYINGLNTHKTDNSLYYIVIALLGKIKGEANGKHHLIPCINVTSSGIDVRHILYLLLEQKRKLGYEDGPGITDLQGRVYSTRDIDDMLHEILEDIFQSAPNLFPTEIVNKMKCSDDPIDEIREYYSCFRTFRRSSDSRALNMKTKLKKDDVDIVNRR